jgi:hypothetical protein
MYVYTIEKGSLKNLSTSMFLNFVDEYCYDFIDLFVGKEVSILWFGT